MSKYFLTGNYTVEGTKGLIKDGGTSRKEAAAKTAASLDGSLESFHFSAVSPNFFILLNLPNKIAAAAFGATVTASGAVEISECVEVLTPAEMDEAAKKMPSYRAPGQ